MTIIKKIPRNKSPKPVRANSVGPDGLTCSKHPWRVAAMRWQPLLYIILLLYILDVGQAFPFQKNEPTKTKVCSGELDIRNDVSNFEKYLRNCTVIEGSLSILLIEYSGAQDYDTLHFPELVEITDYLLLYRVYGLRTLRHIFPNLAIIGGQLLFYDYALVVFEMQDMDELGLRGLTQIRRGAVRIEKNPQLCYINTIDWSILAKNITMEDHIFSGNRERDECVNFCPKDETGRDTCPTVIQDQGQATPVCWSSYDCQIRATDCPNNARNIIDNKTCCHEECLGGCTGPGSEHCLACKNVLKDNRCLKRCDPHTYKFRGWRCISARECEEMQAEGKDNWKLHKKQCLKECPHGYRDSEENQHRCAQCKGRCPKVCKGGSIDSVSIAQSLAGCTVITSQLLIHIQGGVQVSKVLEQYLGSVEEVYDYVSIVRSNQLASLHFLKNLKVIHGNHLYDSKYSLVLLDNQNLEEIWDFDTHPNLTIKRGNMSIHQNPRLCMNKIQELRRRTGFTEKINPTEIGTNGDKATCEHQEIKLQVYNMQKNVVFVNFTNIKLSDERELLGYVARFKEAPERNLTKRGAHNLCDSDGWMSLDVQSDTNQTFVLFIIYDLKSWTQYGVYLETYTLSSAVLGGESKITYFRTNADVPTNPQEVKVSVKQAGELTVSWKPPREPNGNVTHYYVYWLPKKLKTEEYERRNYCLFKLHLANKGEKPEVDREDKPQNRTGPCCSCPKSEKQLELEQAERMFMIRFENFLHNTVYKKRPVSLNREEEKKEERRKRSAGIINETDHQGFHDLMNQTGTTYNISQMPHEHNMTDEPEDVVPYHAAVVYYKTEIVLSDLHHFQEYSIEVIACHEYAEGTDERLCSNRAITTARTLKKDDADTIDHTNVTVIEEIDAEEQEIQLRIKWPEPPAPNGIIITYEIEYQHMQKAAEEFRPYQFCITHRQYLEKHGWVLPKLTPGNYSYKLRATSLAGNGSWTPDLYFFVEDIGVTKNGIGNEIVAGIAASAALVIVFFVALGVWFIAKKRFNQGTPNGILYASVNPEYISVGKWDTYVPDEWEVPRDKICLLRELGQGSFGMVYEGIAKNLWPDKSDEVRVAVKTVNEGASLRDRIEFLNEASVMKAFNCNHVVRLLGVVSQGQPTLVIMELMANGDLKNYLRQHRPDEEDNNGQEALTLRQILQMAGEIADGMAYLASKKYVHRDLAARNCMVAESLTVKIGDFGMTRDIYERDYYRKGGKGLLPVRWMAPESLKDGVFTSLSDVWSYGVVLWEMATLAAQPYQGLSNEQVLKFVIDAGLMEKPEGCPDKLFMLMQKCWQYTAKRRPTFHEIIEILVPDLEEDFKEKSYFFSPENQSEMTSERQAAATAGDTNQEGTIDLDEEEDYIEKPDVHTPLTGSPKNGVNVRNADAALLSEAASSSRHNNQPGASPDTVTVEIMPEHDKLYRQVSSDSNATPTAPPSEGSKGSSKSSSSGYSHMNGLANGHLPIHVPNSMQC